MFYNCYCLTSVDTSKFNAKVVTDMKEMFTNCYSLKGLDLSTFDTSSVTDMFQLFCNCYSLETLDVSNFDTSKITNMENFFYNCQSLKSLDLSSFDTSSVTDMLHMFYYCISLTSLDISQFNTAKITNMEQLFYNCQSLQSLSLSSFDTTLVTTMKEMFYECKSLKFLDISSFNTPAVSDIYHMFYDCLSITSLDFSKFKTNQITSMEQMFYNCLSLRSLDLSSFDTSSVTDMIQMFYNCLSLTSLDVSSFDTSEVTNMFQMFSNCKSLSSINLLNFNTGNVINMQEMFKTCLLLTSLDLSSFDISQVTTMESMLDGCSNLNYINIKNYIDNSDLNINNMFSFIPDGIVYCVLDDNSIPYELRQKSCSINDCSANWLENKKNSLEVKKTSLNIINDKCVLKNIKELSEDFYISNKISNTSIYSYKLDSSTDTLKKENTNITYFDFNSDSIDFLMNHFGLNKEQNSIYIMIADTPSKDSRSATSDYQFVLILDNGTELKLTDINEDFYINVSVPIRDLDLAKFDYAKYFGDQGFDIYDKNSNFYKDFCTPASYDNNDITLKDRKNDIYPNNVTLCKTNCVYKSIDIEEQRIICECNLNVNNDKANEEDNSLNEEEEEDDGNLITYFIDKVNYKLFKCYNLILDFENLKNNFLFYAILCIFTLIILLSFTFLCCGLATIRIEMYKDMPTAEKVKKMLIEELKKIKESKKDLTKNNPTRKHSSKIFSFKRKSKKNINDSKTSRLSEAVKFKKFKINNNKNNLRRRSQKSIESEKNAFVFTGNYFSNNKLSKKNLRFSTNIPKFNKNIKFKKNSSKKQNLIYSENSIEEFQKETEYNDDFNDLPFKKALKTDKRNIFQLFKSILFQKLELVNLFIIDHKIRIICICEYILSLLFDFFFNALLYSDEVVSQKYHNNGELDFIVSLMISIVSNIITSIVCNFIEYSEGIEERLEQISEIRREYKYLFALNKFLKFLKIKMLLFIITEIILVGGCFYYIVIFGILYNKSKISLLTNYFYSLLEGLLTSLIITIIIVITRQIGILYSNSYFYNTSKYLNDKF